MSRQLCKGFYHTEAYNYSLPILGKQKCCAEGENFSRCFKNLTEKLERKFVLLFEIHGFVPQWAALCNSGRYD